MAEPVAIESTPTQPRAEQSSRARWLRLLRSTFWFGSYAALISLATDVYRYVRGEELVGATTLYLFLKWLTKALVEGLLMGLFLAFPMWLAREEFPRPKRRQRDDATRTPTSI